MVGSHFKEASVFASPGFDGLPIPFLEYVFPLSVVIRWITYILVLLIARTFMDYFSDARVPACWKAARLSPLHKKGTVSNPGSYRVTAASGVMYFVYANVLKDLVTDWCVQRKRSLTPNLVFILVRATLHPRFISRHLNHAAKKLKVQQSPRLHAAFIGFSQSMTQCLGFNFGTVQSLRYSRDIPDWAIPLQR
eukprot:scaffold198506_cov17-Tisochrysis_lutea.AAC.1